MPVAQSSHVQEYDYDAETGSLVVQFVNGAVYRWTGIDQTEYDNFHQSGSKGSYMQNKLIPSRGKGQKLASGVSQARRRRY